MKEEYKTTNENDEDFSGAFFDDDQLAQLNGGTQGDADMLS